MISIWSFAGDLQVEIDLGMRHPPDHWKCWRLSGLLMTQSENLSSADQPVYRGCGHPHLRRHPKTFHKVVGNHMDSHPRRLMDWVAKMEPASPLLGFRRPFLTHRWRRPDRNCAEGFEAIGSTSEKERGFPCAGAARSVLRSPFTEYCIRTWSGK